MLIVGTVIGAGFASGAEIVSFFGKVGISPLCAVICGIAVFGCCVLFLYLGAKNKPKDVGELNVKIAGKLHIVCDVFLLVNALIVTAGMLAAFNSIGDTIFDFFPVYALAFGLVAVVIVSKGIGGVIKVNAVALPVVIVTMLIVCCLSLNHASLDCDFFRFKPLTGLIYVSMNMILACSALTSVHTLSKKEIIVSSALAALVVTALMTCIILALNSTGDFYTALPTLDMAKNISPILFGLMLAAMSVSVFTTLLTSMNCLTDYAQGVIKNRKIAALAVLIVGLFLANLGFEKVVTLLYPVIGCAGLFYILLGIVYAVRNSERYKRRRARRAHKNKPSSLARDTLFDERHTEVHDRRKHA